MKRPINHKPEAAAFIPPHDAQLEAAWEARRDAFNTQTATGLQNLLPPGAAQKAGISPELLEFLEMDFDKILAPGTAKP